MTKPITEKSFPPHVPILLVLVFPEAVQVDFRLVAVALAAAVLAVVGNFLYCIN